jgi:aminoglycoside phosphotransferase (APT) family kinase protein
VVGILDWTAAILGDPARDFVTAATVGGWGFVDRILEHYTGAVDPGFRQRLRYMARLLAVMWLGEARLNGGDTEKHIAWVEHAFDAAEHRRG